MGKLKGLHILYDNTPVFAGQTLSGSINFTTKDSVSLRSIAVTFDGHSKVTFSSTDEGRPEKYFHITLPLNGYLSGWDNGLGKHKVPAGPHSVPFRFPLPGGLPTSYGGRLGYVHYSVTATLTTSSAAEVSASRPFQVVGLEDLNWHPQAALPFSLHQAFAQRTLCVKTLDVAVALSLPRTGFVPGQPIPVSGEVLNRSGRRKLKEPRVLLLQHSSADMGGRQREASEVVAELSLGALGPGALHRLEEEPLTVPALPPSILRGCRQLSLAYELVLSADPRAEVRVPILIGTVPFTAERLRRVPRALPWRTGPPSRPTSRLIEDAVGPLPPKPPPSPPQSESPPKNGFVPPRMTGPPPRGAFVPPPVYRGPPPPPGSHRGHPPPPRGHSGPFRGQPRGPPSLSSQGPRIRMAKESVGPRAGLHRAPPFPPGAFPQGLRRPSGPPTASGPRGIHVRLPFPPVRFGGPRGPPPPPFGVLRSRRSRAEDPAPGQPIVEEPSDDEPHVPAAAPSNGPLITEIL